jgi:hypothetical protein
MPDKEGPYATLLVGWIDRHRGQAHTVHRTAVQPNRSEEDVAYDGAMIDRDEGKVAVTGGSQLIYDVCLCILAEREGIELVDRGLITQSFSSDFNHLSDVPR